MQDFQPERPQVQPEAEENTEYQHELASHDDTLPLGSSGLGLVYDLKGTEHIVSMVVDDFAPVDVRSPACIMPLASGMLFRISSLTFSDIVLSYVIFSTK